MPDANMETHSAEKLQRPKKYAVKFFNDDFTTVEFVVEVLVQIFKLGKETAESFAMEIHQKGAAGVGPYTHEVAESRAVLAMQWARLNEHPLRCQVHQVPEG